MKTHVTKSMERTFTTIILPNSHPSGFYWGHLCSWALTSANGLEASNIQTFYWDIHRSSVTALDVLQHLSLVHDHQLVPEVSREVHRQVGLRLELGRAQLANVLRLTGDVRRFNQIL